MPVFCERARTLALAFAAALACAHDPGHDPGYDPSRDRKLPRPPKVVEWTHSVTIDASPEVVWDVLTDFSAYVDWNPWLIAASGPAEPGARVDITVVLDDKRRDMWHRVVSVEPGRRFCWRDGGPTTSFATGLRCRELEDLGGGKTRFTVVLTVGGSFRETVRRRYGDELQAAMEAETAALAVEAARRSREDRSTSSSTR